MSQTGVLLINLGTPQSPSTKDVRAYLREFLADPRVIDLPKPLRLFILYAFILPFRPKQSAKAYQAIWTDAGSPLLTHSQDLCAKVQARLGKNYHVELGMRYGMPNITQALSSLSHCEKLIILPLFPQYSSAATGSALDVCLKTLSLQTVIPSVSIIRDFYQQDFFINSQSLLIDAHLDEDDYLLLSYHGLPERHILATACRSVCQARCPKISTDNRSCYRAQCFATSQAIATRLKRPAKTFSTSFQSRLGKTPWIKPYTDEQLDELAQQGIKKLAIASPAFTADCLETLEELGIQAKKQWLSLGGESFKLIPCLNANDQWVTALAGFIQTLSV